MGLKLDLASHLSSLSLHATLPTCYWLIIHQLDIVLLFKHRKNRSANNHIHVPKDIEDNLKERPDTISVLKGTFFASGVIRSTKEELKGTHPLNMAPPPKVFGYSKTLAKVKAPAKLIAI